MTDHERQSALQRLLPWIVGAVCGGLFLTGGVLFAQRGGHLEKLPGVGPPELENELSESESPYLQSAAEQPVHWQMWGKEAFRLAEQLDRPVWLDVGAIWCHWCHVMDRESYENPKIADIINERLVPIKVDRDRRPDIDDRYQAAFRALNQRGGGWPLTMMLTPAGEPFAGFTYLPPTRQQGRPGIEQLAPRIARAFRQRRGEVTQLANRVDRRLAEMRSRSGASGELTPDLVRRIADGVAQSFDAEHGGFGEGQKFPNGPALRFALAEGFLSGDDALRERALHTLDAYAASGIYDHVRGGFFRYGVDREMTRPHFEKMDYVQAGMLRAYLDAYRMTGDSAYAETARDVMRYVDRTLSDREGGGFYPHQDADVSLEDDGSYYTWSPDQLRAAVGPEQVDAVRLRFGITEDGEMPEHPRQNVPQVERSVAEVAQRLGVAEAEARGRIRAGLRQMKAARDTVEAPRVEKTKFVDRNAYLITAYLDAWKTLGDEDARGFALKSLDYVLEHGVDADGTVYHTAVDEGEPATGLMRDYAYLADALADAHQVTGERRYLDAAGRVMDRAVELFWDDENGGFWDRPEDADAPGLLDDRGKTFGDSPMPGDNAVAARALEKLFLLTTRDRWRELADRTLSAFAGQASGRGTFASTYGMAAELHLNKTAQTVVIGSPDRAATRDLARAAWTTYRPGRMVNVYDPATVSLDSLPDAVAGAARASDEADGPQAYVCVGRTCAPPTSSAEQVRTLVREYGRRGGSGGAPSSSTSR